MKRRIFALAVTFTLAITMLYGCGKKETPAEEVPPEPAQEASTEEVEAAPSKEASVEEVKEPARPTSLDDAIGLAIMDYNKEFFTSGELSGEGHILMDKDGDDSKGEQKCYVLSMFGQYEFQDGNFVKCAGTGVIPCVITLELNDEGEYNFISLKEAEDGSGFVNSIKENFPEALWARCITIEDDDRIELERQERAYAEEYISRINREDAEIGDYADFEHTLLTDEGVSVDVSNALLDVESGDGFENNCTMWLGEREVLEDNVRYIYKKEYDSKKKTVTYSKIMYDTGDVLESSVYSTNTGEKIE